MRTLIKPYDEHYMNCYLNNLYSIACSYDKNYKLLSYKNDFHYSIIKNENKCKLHFDYTNDFYLSIYNAIYNSAHGQQLDIFKIPLGEKKEINLQTFKDVPSWLLNNQILFIIIDLFNFNNKNIFYNKIHREHFLLIIGYDQNKKEFMVLDNGNKGYGVYNIAYSNLYSLIDKDTPHGYVLDISKVKLFNQAEINNDDIKNNANRLINETIFIVNEISETSFPRDYSEYCELLIFVQRCFNRHISNKYLLEHLNTDKNIALNKLLFDINKKLISNWYNIRARMLKNTLAETEIQYEKIFQKLKLMFEDEIAFWSLLKKCL